MARVYKGHPFIVVPDVDTHLSRERVLVTDYVDGTRFTDAVTQLTQAERDRAGEILVRFYVNGPLRHRLLNGDPHPGNNLFMGDGRIAFIDFGFFKTMTDTDVRQLVASTRATYERDPEALLAVVTELGSLPHDPRLAQPFFDNYEAIFGWLMVDEPLKADPSKTADMMRRYTEMRGADGFDRMTLPAEHFVLMRAIFLLIGLLGQLEAENAWFDIAREWLVGEEPVTDLGRQEQEFFAGTHEYTTAAQPA
jgi:predicted unusual protein kinase regulating ubiquinone biosynthesis (AarF/ABC1/UbiB family)